MDWEKIEGFDDSETTWRTPIFGGWIVEFYGSDGELRAAIFVPDPEYRWDGKSVAWKKEADTQ